MNTSLRKYLINGLIALLSLGVVLTASAQHYHRGWGWGFGSGLVGGVYIGSQMARPYYYQPYPPPMAYQPPIVVQAPSPVYVTPTPSTVQTPPPVSNHSVWYFCESVNNFYPNVSSCPEGWKQVNTNSSSAYTPEVPPDSSSISSK
jgi:hypothetical protein